MTVPGTVRRAWLVWGVGLFAYVVAVFDRASLGVAGLAAQQRFGINAAELASLSVVQLGLYAVLQVPVGSLLDRLGSRRIIIAGSLTMAAGQLMLGSAHHVALGLAARGLVGVGDAVTFLSVIRLIPSWFSATRTPLVTQLTGVLGQAGQLAAAYPLAWALTAAGWTASFSGAAVIGVGAALAVAVVVRDEPVPRSRGRAQGVRPALVQLRAAWRSIGTRTGLWTHFTSQFPNTAFALLWGYPFLVAGEGLTSVAATVLLSLMVVLSMGIGPVFGHLVGRDPARRLPLTLTVVALTVLTWTAVLAWPERAPPALLVALVVVLASNGPGAVVGFDYARTHNPAGRFGSAIGIVNVGGFVASILAILGIGLVLDLVSGTRGGYSLNAFRAAFLVQYPIWLIGLSALLRNHRRMQRNVPE